MNPRILRALGARGGRAARAGAFWTVATLLLQLLLVVSGSARGQEAPPTRSLAAVAVVQPPFGEEAGVLGSRSTWPEGSQVQLTFEPDTEGWTSVLWFSGDRIEALYPDPDLDQTGLTGGSSYAVPGPGQWLRVSRTPPDGDFLALVHGPLPDPRVEATLSSPHPEAVRRLRSALESEAHGWSPNPRGVQRYLPTADGRAIPVSWGRTVSSGAMVRGWTLKTDP